LGLLAVVDRDHDVGQAVRTVDVCSFHGGDDSRDLERLAGYEAGSSVAPQRHQRGCVPCQHQVQVAVGVEVAGSGPVDGPCQRGDRRLGEERHLGGGPCAAGGEKVALVAAVDDDHRPVVTGPDHGQVGHAVVVEVADRGGGRMVDRVLTSGDELLLRVQGQPSPGLGQPLGRGSAGLDRQGVHRPEAVFR